MPSFIKSLFSSKSSRSSFASSTVAGSSMQIKTPSPPHSENASPTSTIAEPIHGGEVTIAASADSQSLKMLVTLTPPTKLSDESPKSRDRAPLDICCVIDVSGSMQSEAPVPGDPAPGEVKESTGLSVLDVVKHSLRTIITTMKPDDRIAVVTFSDAAKVVCKFTEMTESGKTSVLKTVEGLQTEGCTNLWDGLKVGMNLLHDDRKSRKSNSSSSDRLSTLFILTDGMPNVEPPRGHIPMLKAYLDAHPKTQFSISTFGFGYSLNSPLLLQIAQVGGGGYGFIPDSGMVGTVFVHAVANTYSTYAPRAKLHVEVPEGTEVQVKGDLPVQKTTWGVQIDAGDIQFGQPRDFVLTFSKMSDDISVSATYRPFSSQQDLKTDVVLYDQNGTPDLASIEYQAARLEFVEILYAANESNHSDSIAALKALEQRIIKSPVLANHADALALAQDMSGEGLLALQSRNFKKWGRHYFPSLARSHQRQQCGNFKDPGLQIYGRDSSIFLTERDQLDAAFNDLPPPKPSIVRYTSSGATVPTTQLKSMSAYYSSAGPCFGGSCLVVVSSGERVRVEQLKRGMRIMTMAGPRTVAAVVKTSGDATVCQIGDSLEVTPWHPVFMHGSWVFPAQVTAPEHTTVLSGAVYSILLEPGTDANAHTICVSGVWCVTLGHGITASAVGDVRAHVFLGDYEKVLESISRLDGFSDKDGVVQCVGTSRSLSDGNICGFVGEVVDMRGEGIVAKAEVLVY